MSTHKTVEIGGKVYRVTFSEIKQESVASVLLLGFSAIALTAFLSFSATSTMLENLLPGTRKVEAQSLPGKIKTPGSTDFPSKIYWKGDSYHAI